MLPSTTLNILIVGNDGVGKDALAQALQARMKDVQARHAQEVSSITGKYEQLCGAVKNYHARLEQAMVTPTAATN